MPDEPTPTDSPAAGGNQPTPGPTPPAVHPAARTSTSVAPAPQGQQAQTATGTDLASQGITPALLAQLAQQAQGQSQQPRHASDSDRDISRLPQWAQSEIRRLRDDEAGYRVRYKEEAASSTALRKAIAEHAGLDVSEVSVDSLGELFSFAAAEAQRATVTQATVLAALEHQADASALLNWAPFLDAAEALDPTADDFKTQLSDLVKATVEKTPMLRTQGQAPARAMPARSGAEIPAGSGNPQVITRDDLSRMSPSEIDAALSDGRLDHMFR